MNLFKPENEFKVGWCPICNQGWQVIIMDADTGKLFVQCEECLSVWDNPRDLKMPQKALSNGIDLIEDVPPYEKIAKEGLEQYLITEVQENSSM